MPEHSQDRIESGRVRRAPKFSVFLLVGAVLGLVVALILTFAFDGTAGVSPNTGIQYSQAQVFGFLALICVTIGVLLGGLVALVFDRRSTTPPSTSTPSPARTATVTTDPGHRPGFGSARGVYASSAMIGWIAASKAATSPRSPSVTAIVSDPIHHTPRCVSGSTCTLSSNE